MTIGELIKNKDYDCIEYRMKMPNISAYKNCETIFIGYASSKKGELISLDGDTYSKGEKVLKWEEWSRPDKGIANGLTVFLEVDHD